MRKLVARAVCIFAVSVAFPAHAIEWFYGSFCCNDGDFGNCKYHDSGIYVYTAGWANYYSDLNVQPNVALFDVIKVQGEQHGCPFAQNCECNSYSEHRNFTIYYIVNGNPGVQYRAQGSTIGFCHLTS
jgi:hypothetical protein